MLPSFLPRPGDGSPVPRARVALAVAIALGVAVAVTLFAGPRGGRDGLARLTDPAPVAELLLEAGDSTYWIASEGRGLRVRGAPVLLAQLDGRFHELYVTDDDRSYYDAVFVGQRLWRRDLVSGDSAMLLEDTLVASAARRWARRHPDDRPLDGEEAENDDPATVATGEIEVLEVHGPWVSIEMHSNLDLAGERHVHRLHRRVVDVRTGDVVPLARVAGESLDAVLAMVRTHYAAALDSVRRAYDERGRRAARAIAGFPFDSTSFSLAVAAGRPAIALVVPGEGDDAGGLALPLPAVPVPVPAWWREVAALLPAAVSDTLDRWPLGPALALEAVYDEAAGRVRIALRDAAGTRWPAGRVQAPARTLRRLDRPDLDTATRRGLARAFDESALYSEEARTVAWIPHERVRPSHPARPSRRCAHVVHDRGRARPLHQQPHGDATPCR